MAIKVLERDFYFGAILSVLLKGKYTPSLLSTDSDSGRIYEFSVNNEPDFILMMKHSSKPTKQSLQKDYNSWVFSFSQEELDVIQTHINEMLPIRIAFLCGMETLYHSELALMDNEDIKETIYYGNRLKSRITIRRNKRQKCFMIFRGKSPEKAYLLKGQILSA